MPATQPEGNEGVATKDVTASGMTDIVTGTVPPPAATAVPTAAAAGSKRHRSGLQASQGDETSSNEAGNRKLTGTGRMGFITPQASVPAAGGVPQSDTSARRSLRPCRTDTTSASRTTAGRFERKQAVPNHPFTGLAHRWAVNRGLDVHAVDWIIDPIHLDMHWALAVLDLRTRSGVYG